MYHMASFSFDDWFNPLLVGISSRDTVIIWLRDNGFTSEGALRELQLEDLPGDWLIGHKREILGARPTASGNTIIFISLVSVIRLY